MFCHFCLLLYVLLLAFSRHQTYFCDFYQLLKKMRVCVVSVCVCVEVALYFYCAYFGPESFAVILKAVLFLVQVEFRF